MKKTTQIEQVDINKLIPYINNARTHSQEQINKIRASLREFGFVNPVIVDKDYNIIAGHGRVLAAKEEGIEEVPCVLVDYLTEAQKKAYILADNKLALDAGWDDEILRNELASLKELNFDITLTGFENEELEAILGTDTGEAVEDNYEIDLPETPQSKYGEIYQLGNHRLMCGDSTKAEDVAKLMDGAEADLLFTDPPYNVNISNSQGMMIENDNLEDSKFRDFIITAMKNAADNLKMGGGAIFGIQTAKLSILE